MNDTPDTQETPAPPRTTFAELCAAVAKPMHLTVEVDGVPRTIALRRLTSAQRTQVDDLYSEAEQRSNRVLPPLVRDRNQESMPDERSPEYRKALAGMRRRARAMVLALAWEDLATAASGQGIAPGDHDTLVDWIESRLPENLIEVVYLRLLTDGLHITLADRVSFTSAGG